MKQSDQKTPISGLRLYTFLFLSLLSFTAFSQAETIVVFDSNLDTVKFEDIRQKSTYVVVYTHKGCLGCIEYLINEGITNHVIYFLDNLSIAEARQVVSKNSGSCKSYFILRSTPFFGIRDTERGPVLLSASDPSRILRYDDLIKLTEDFSLKGREVKKKLKKWRDQ